MDFFKQKRVLVWLVAVLLLVNVAAILTMIYHVYFSSDNEISAVMPDAGQIVVKELNFDEEQQRQYHEFRQDYILASEPVLKQMTEIRHEILNEVSESLPDTAKLNSLADNIGKQHASMKKTTIAHLLRVKAICNPSQQDNLDRLILEMMQSEGAFKGMGRKFQFRHGQGAGHGRQNKN
jgi:Spy/CpxP family protein refolding chaperone